MPFFIFAPNLFGNCGAYALLDMIEALNNTSLYIALCSAIALGFGIGFITKFILDKRQRKDYRSIAGELEVKRVRYKKLRSDFQQLQTEMDHQRVELHKLRELKGGDDQLKTELLKRDEEILLIKEQKAVLDTDNNRLKQKLSKAESSSAVSNQHKELKKKFVILQKNHSSLKAEFEKLKQSNQVHADYDALFQAHQQLKRDFDLIRLQFRELEIENASLQQAIKESTKT